MAAGLSGVLHRPLHDRQVPDGGRGPPLSYRMRLHDVPTLPVLEAINLGVRCRLGQLQGMLDAVRTLLRRLPSLRRWVLRVHVTGTKVLDQHSAAAAVENVLSVVTTAAARCDRLVLSSARLPALVLPHILESIRGVRCLVLHLAGCTLDWPQVVLLGSHWPSTVPERLYVTTACAFYAADDGGEFDAEPFTWQHPSRPSWRCLCR